MTWDEFVAQVESQLSAKDVSRSTPLAWIQWNRDAFGGPIPSVHVNVLNAPDETAALGIGED